MLQTKNGKRVIIDLPSLPTTGESKYLYHNTTDGFFYYWNDAQSKHIKLENLNVISTVQPTPTFTGNTTNLNSTFKDANGDSWVVDSDGDAIRVGLGNTGDKYKTTSPTCNDIVPTGNLTFTVATGLAYTPLQDVIIVAEGTGSNHMHGEVVIYNSLTGELIVSIKQKEGSGNHCNWTINLDAIKLNEVSVYFGSNDPLTAGQVGIEGDLWYKTSNGNNSGQVIDTWVYDGTTWIKVDSQIQDYATIVYFNSTTPSTATIFDLANPPVTNNNALKNLDTAIYVGTNGSTWNSNGTIYSTYIAPASTEWYLANTTTDAGANKTDSIYRLGNTGIGTPNPTNRFTVKGTDSEPSPLGNSQTSATLRVDGSEHCLDMGTILGSPWGSYIQSHNKNNTSSLPLAINPLGGNVGIGILNPNAQVEIATNNGLTTLLRRGGAGGQTPPNLIFQKTSGVNASTHGAVLGSDFVGRILFSASNGSTYPLNGTDIVCYAAGLQSASNNGSGIFFRTVPQNSVAQSVERMRISDNGNIGINTGNPLSRLDINGSFGAVVRSSATNTTTSNDYTLLMTTANTVATLELPTNVSKRIIFIKNTSAGTVSVTGHIDGTASRTIVLLSKESIKVQSDGTTWQVLAKYNTASPIAVSTQMNSASIPNATDTNVTSYTNVFDRSNGAWNPTTGIYTCNKAGIYRFEFKALFYQSMWSQGQEAKTMFYKNNTFLNTTSSYVSSTYTQYVFAHHFSLINLEVGDQIKVVLRQNAGNTRDIFLTEYNTFLINEV
jgi:hypothetical protein